MAVSMTYQHKKMAVLQVLRQKKGDLSLSELMKILGSDFRPRSVRRWLSLLAKEGLVEKIGQKRGTRYRAVEKETATQIVGGFSQQSLEAINYTHQPLFQRKPVTYNESWIKEYQPNKSAYFTQRTKDQLHKAGQRSKDEEPAGTYARHIYNRLLIDLSFNSSRLEGNTYSLLDTKRLLIEGQGVEGKLDEEKVMILNHKEAIRYLIDDAGKITICPTAICTLHYLLSDSLIEAKYSGKVRDYGVRIGGSTYIPFENPRVLEKQLNVICHKAAAIHDPYEQSFFLLTHVSYLQAFIDVNKRTSRLSANIPLIQKNLVPLSFNDIRKDDYASAMIAIYELNDPHPLLDLFTNSYLRTCDLYNATIEAMGFDQVRVRYRQQRREIIRHIIVNLLKGKSMHDYIQSQSKRLVNPEDLVNFLEDVQEDLKELSPQRIAGLGITIEQLNEWNQV